MEIIIRPESPSDHRKVEEVTREAFWNLYVPGCDEHYLAHILRDHPDFINELDFVAELNGEVIGNIMFTKSYVENERGEMRNTLTFGPVCILPEFQRTGIGSKLIRHTLKLAQEAGYKAVIIYGDPQNYCKHGFKCSKDYCVTDPDGIFPYGLLVLELEKGFFEGYSWKYYCSKVYEINKSDAEEFDKEFPPKAKEYRHTQDVFSIQCRAKL